MLTLSLCSDPPSQRHVPHCHLAGPRDTGPVVRLWGGWGGGSLRDGAVISAKGRLLSFSATWYEVPLSGTSPRSIWADGHAPPRASTRISQRRARPGEQLAAACPPGKALSQVAQHPGVGGR